MAWKGNARSGKFNAKRTLVDGILFASQKEAKRYRELRLLERAGEISGLVLQPKYLLCAAKDSSTTAWADDNSLRVVGVYIADFWYRNKERQVIVEDAKGFKTPLYKWKKKHVEAQYGIQIQEV